MHAGMSQCELDTQARSGMVRGRWERFCDGHGTSDASLARLEFFVGCLGWTKANKERKCAGGGWGRSSHRKPRIKTLAGLCGHRDHTAGPRG